MTILRSLLGSGPRCGGLTALTLLCALAAPTASASGAALTVLVQGVRSDQGTMRLCLWTSEKGFPDCTADAARRDNKPATTGDMRFDLLGIPAGIYAVTVFHDENNTNRVETNFLGIPRSGLGASNNPRARFGPPSFRDAVFRLNEPNGQITIRMVYP
jgi:uncharacterized protein (DUF2141 family)